MKPRHFGARGASATLSVVLDNHKNEQTWPGCQAIRAPFVARRTSSAICESTSQEVALVAYGHAVRRHSVAHRRLDASQAPSQPSAIRNRIHAPPQGVAGLFSRRVATPTGIQ
jgi:hypothetical protein